MENGYFNYVFNSHDNIFTAIGEDKFGHVDPRSAYLQVPVSAAGSRQAITLRFDDTNGIDGVEATDGQPFDVYSLSGTLVKQGATDLKQLPRGIYVVGGRKVVVK